MSRVKSDTCTSERTKETTKNCRRSQKKDFVISLFRPEIKSNDRNEVNRFTQSTSRNKINWRAMTTESVNLVKMSTNAGLTGLATVFLLLILNDFVLAASSSNNNGLNSNGKIFTLLKNWHATNSKRNKYHYSQYSHFFTLRNVFSVGQFNH